jgi:hypothetical protein
MGSLSSFLRFKIGVEIRMDADQALLIAKSTLPKTNRNIALTGAESSEKRAIRNLAEALNYTVEDSTQSRRTTRRRSISKSRNGNIKSNSNTRRIFKLRKV